MRLLQRLNQYQRLYQFAGDVPVSATVAELAAIICCSDRHVRTLLGQLQEAGWIRWQASAGRGRRGSLRCLLPVSQLRRQLMEHLLREGNHQGALRLAARDPAQLTPICSPISAATGRPSCLPYAFLTTARWSPSTPCS